MPLIDSFIPEDGMRMRVVLFFIILLLVPATFARGGEGRTGEDARVGTSRAVVEYDKSAQRVVVQFSEVLGEVGEADSGPEMQVHGDGLVVVRFPPYMKRAGTYSMVLTPPALDALVASLLDKRLADFDEARVAKQKREAEVEKQKRARQKTVFFSSDPSRISIELQVERYVSADGKATARGVDRKISWSGLREDARRYDEVEALQGLAAATTELRSLMQSPELVRVD